MKILREIFFIAVSVTLLSACDKDEDLDLAPPVGLGGQTYGRTALDQWLLDSLTTPYNIAVKYRWDPWELNLDVTLTPPDESKIIPAMSALKRVWIEPFNAETGSDEFIKKYSPKQFKLVGSVQYNVNGTVLLGQAEGGNNIAFFDVNQNFDRNSVTSIMRMIQTSHHEFAHILNQNVIYPPEFKGLSSRAGLTGYTATWFNVSTEEALENGYITPYSMASSDEDFVEMVANMLMQGRDRFDEIVASVNETAQQVLRSKEQFVVNYFKEVWNIDFYSLQSRINAALNALVPPPTVEESYGFDKTHTTASVDFNNQSLLPQRATFMLMIEQAQEDVAAIPQFGLTLDSFALLSPEANLMVLRMYIGQDGNVFFADFEYTENISSGVRSYTYVDANENGDVIKDAVQPILDYFSNNQFTVTWHTNPSVSIYPRVKFTPAALNVPHFLALLLP